MEIDVINHAYPVDTQDCRTVMYRTRIDITNSEVAHVVVFQSAWALW